MTAKLVLLILGSVCLSALAQVALKLGTGAVSAAHPSGVGHEMSQLLQSPLVLSGLALYGIGASQWNGSSEPADRRATPQPSSRAVARSILPWQHPSVNRAVHGARP
ncbi:hypothetical protein [Sphingomonas sp. DT-204]|uniref:hypothetical protein n=1 Tax=Sphingomonas sp. DT-204 TaxID=3396166 RepID=UPI003F1DD050